MEEMAEEKQEPIPEGWDLEAEEGDTLVLSRRGRFWSVEWTIGPDRLEIRQTDFAIFKKARQYTGASLEIDMSAGAGGGESRLAVNKLAKRYVIASDFYPDNIRRLGLFLAERTGWPLKTLA